MMIKILYNDCYGGGSEFSPAFAEEIIRRTNGSVDVSERWQLVGGPTSIRCNTDVIALFEEKGSEWSSGPNCTLALYEIPEAFSRYWEIDERNGSESVRVLVAEIYYDLLETYMESERTPADLEQLHRWYETATAAVNALQAAAGS